MDFSMRTADFEKVINGLETSIEVLSEELSTTNRFVGDLAKEIATIS